MTLFFDADILVHTQDFNQPEKQAMSRALVQEALHWGFVILSPRVMEEFYTEATERLHVKEPQAIALLRLWCERGAVVTTPDLMFRAFELRQAENLPLRDALTVQAALDGGCFRMLSTRLPHRAQYGALQVINPYVEPPPSPIVPQVHEPRPRYTPAPARKRGPPKAG